MSLILVKDDLGMPKYKQIVLSIENALLDGSLKKGDRLPSINAIRNQNKLSRDTILQAFNELKVRGIVQSIAGKGYYVKSEKINIKQKIFLLFDELNAFKESIYNAFIQNLDKNVEVDIFFHHFNMDVFNNLIYNNIGNYNYYIIMPANLKNTDLVIRNLPKDKVYILDQTYPELSSYPAIFQNFEKDIYLALKEGFPMIQKYKKFFFISPNYRQPIAMITGFEKFCKEYKIEYEIILTIENRELEKGDIYLIPDDKNLILVIKKMRASKFVLAKDIGIISYNETVLKEIVEGGITTISTDFKKMGTRLAQMITNNERVKIENSSSLILRNSI